PVTVCNSTLSGRRMPFSPRNLLVGEILPRAMPVRSLIRHSTSVILCSFSQPVSWSSLLLMVTSDCGFSRWVRSALCCARPAGFGEALDKRQVGRMFVHLPFRVPLHAEAETACRLDGKRLDQPVGRQGLDAQPLALPFDTLAMHRVDLDFARQAEALQQPARLYVQRMAPIVLYLLRIIRTLALVLIRAVFVHLLVQAAAEGHVHLLESATDAEHRNAGIHRGADQRQRQLIARRVVR